ncbi:MAG: efflux RND transporter periplasmic adaptor subunit [Tannerella sp.]|jgi:Cu(I)/Ag(I) efflux system membrane fusion protein|nr:efflux RND transporter periplasmic adaptor subunit [Tannerella sp.]
MKTNKTFRYVLYGLIFAAGLLVGRLLSGDSKNPPEHAEHVHAEAEAQVWTCSMHPQIRQDKPGKCPLCAMDLIPLKTSVMPGATPDADAIQLSDEALALADIQTSVVGRSRPVREIRLYGTIKPDERRLRSLVSHVSGRIETLSVHYAGETVREGQVIATIYSPALLNAQQELLEALRLAASQPALLNAAREKLRLWKLSDAQIAEIERTGKASSTVDLLANAAGVVTAKRVEQGDYVSQGGVLFDLADLSSVWALFDAYEADVPHLKTGDRVEYTLQTLPGKTFTGRISFIDPVLNPSTRTVKVRVETPNPRLELKPEMYADALVRTSLRQQADEIVVPKTAVLWTGKRSVVYVKQPDTDLPVFKMREVALGASLGEAYIILSGLHDGEEVVTHGAFAVDASAQLEGKPSMMNGAALPPAGDGLSVEHARCKVSGRCEMCKERIETAARKVHGVMSASWDIETGQLHLQYDARKTSVAAVAKAVAAAGHDAESYQADRETYDALPECCKYVNND